jgi:hypothetical protein
VTRVVLVLALVLAGCTQSPPPWAELAVQADEAAIWSASETALLVVPGNIAPRDTPEQTATDAADVAWVPFSPNDCVVATVSGATITYALDDCAGSFGLVHATGHLAVTYMQADVPGRLLFHAESSDLVINGGAAHLAADATVDHDEATRTRTIDLTINSDGVGANGTRLGRHGTQLAQWMDGWGCLVVENGHDALSVDGTAWSADLDAITLCVGECPERGGSITWTGGPGSVDVAYGGLPQVDWSVPADPGLSGSMPISCTH